MDSQLWNGVKYVTPALTTVSYPIPQVAREAFTLLNGYMAGDREPSEVPLIETRLVLRDSL